jgi:OOP family OmpA-OmpF porin
MRTILCMSLLVLCFCGKTIAEDSYEHRVNVSLTGGAYDFEGDEAVDDTLTISLHLGLDLTEHWTLEAVLTDMPRLEENIAHSYGARISRLESEAGVDETSAIGIAVDALYHFTRWERLDPYLSVGVGAIYYEDDFDDQTEPTLRVGGGVLYHLSDRFAVRADLRVITAGTDSEINSQADGGIMWTFAKRSTTTAVARIDTDGDGLYDDEETLAGTNPFERDSDFDGLSDSDEINTYKTNPMLRDTDLGKVADGHEVIEDGTNPMAKEDDLQCFELNMQFEGAGWTIQPEYHSDLDAIAAVLRADPTATARIEGHTDTTEKASARRRKRLTRRRAESISEYFQATWKIDAERLKAVGYGSGRPKAANDPSTGNAANRRMEIYIRHTEQNGA